MKKIGLYVAKGSHHTGTFNIDGDVRIDGIFTGSLVINGTLYVGSLGKVEGEVHTVQANIDGLFSGALEAKEQTIFSATTKFNGVLDTPTLQMPSGAELIGTVRICNKRTP